MDMSRAETLETSNMKKKQLQELEETLQALDRLKKSYMYPPDHAQIVTLEEKFDRLSDQLHRKNIESIDQQTQRIDQQTQCIDQQTQRINQQTQHIDQQSQQIGQQNQRIDYLEKELNFSGRVVGFLHVIIGLLLSALNISNHALNECTEKYEEECIHNAETSAEMNKAKVDAVQAKQDLLEERGKNLQTVSAKNQMILDAQGRINGLVDTIGLKNQCIIAKQQLLLASQLFGRGLVVLLRWCNQEHLKTKLRCFGLEGELVKEQQQTREIKVKVESLKFENEQLERQKKVFSKKYMDEKDDHDKDREAYDVLLKCNEKTQDHLKKENDTLRAKINSLRRESNGEQADDGNQEDHNHANGKSHGARRV